MNTQLRRTIVVAVVLATLAYLIVASSRTKRGSQTPNLSRESLPVPGATPAIVAPSQSAPNAEPTATAPAAAQEKSSPVATTGTPVQPAPAPSVEAPASPRPPMPAPAAGSGTAVSAPAPAPATEADFAAVATDLEHVRMIIREFRDVVGENPVGTNAEIMKAVMGDNLKQARIGLPEGQSLNGKGELVDRWGSPYFFHQVSKTEMEIRSAGPDRVMWTDDDRKL